MGIFGIETGDEKVARLIKLRNTLTHQALAHIGFSPNLSCEKLKEVNKKANQLLTNYTRMQSGADKDRVKIYQAVATTINGTINNIELAYSNKNCMEKFADEQLDEDLQKIKELEQAGMQRRGRLKDTDNALLYVGIFAVIVIAGVSFYAFKK